LSLEVVLVVEVYKTVVTKKQSEDARDKILQNEAITKHSHIHICTTSLPLDPSTHPENHPPFSDAGVMGGVGDR
jgi:hypothetical protein